MGATPLSYEAVVYWMRLALAGKRHYENQCADGLDRQRGGGRGGFDAGLHPEQARHLPQKLSPIGGPLRPFANGPSSLLSSNCFPSTLFEGDVWAPALRLQTR